METRSGTRPIWRIPGRFSEQEGHRVDGFMRVKWVWGIACVALLLGIAGCGGGGSNDPTPPEPGEVTGTSADPSEDLTEIAARVGEILDLGYLTIGTEDVMRRTTGISGDPLFVVDTREPADYDDGHIPGAINIPLQGLAQQLLDGTSGIPMDVDVAVASYWGGDGIFACTLINIYRITDPTMPESFKQARSLYCGMTSWSYDRALIPTGTRFDDALAADVTAMEPTEAGTNDGTDQGRFPEFAPFETDPVVDKILIRAGHYLNSVADQRDLTIYPSTVRDTLGDNQIVSVRGNSHYVLGHLPDAINIPWKSSTDLENYTKFVDTEDLVVVYCYTGHSGGAATIALGILGYKARNMVYGMNGWNTSAPASGQLSDFDVNRGWDFPLHTWDGGLSDLDGYKPDNEGCEACHTNLTAVWMDREYDPPVGDTAPPNSGEG